MIHNHAKLYVYIHTSSIVHFSHQTMYQISILARALKTTIFYIVDLGWGGWKWGGSLFFFIFPHCFPSQRKLKPLLRLSLFLERSYTLEDHIAFPSWSSGKESACQGRGHRFDPWSGKIHMLQGSWARAAWQLSPCAQTMEACAHSAGALWQEKPLQWEAGTPQLETSSHSLQLGKDCLRQQRPTAAKIR